MSKSQRRLNKACYTVSIPGVLESLLTFTAKPLRGFQRTNIKNLKPHGKIRRTTSEMQQELLHRCWMLGSPLSRRQLTPRDLELWYTIPCLGGARGCSR